MNKTQLIGQATEDQIAAWKKIHKIDDVFAIKVDGHVCYVKDFDRASMKYALSQVTTTVDEKGKEDYDFSLEKQVEVGEVGLQNGWLGGSESIKQDDKMWISAAMQMGALFRFSEVSLEKL
jgi:hypothetical protein